MSDNPYASTESIDEASPHSNLVNGLSARSGWLTTLGILSIVNGAILVFGITIIFAWMPIWIGVLFLQAANAVNRSKETGSEELMDEGLEKIGLALKITGIAFLAFVGFIILLFLVIFAAAALGALA